MTIKQAIMEQVRVQGKSISNPWNPLVRAFASSPKEPKNRILLQKQDLTFLLLYGLSQKNLYLGVVFPKLSQNQSLLKPKTDFL